VPIFKTKWLFRYARRQRIEDASWKEAIERADRGLIDADLGGGIIKQRVARARQGRSGGHRSWSLIGRAAAPCSSTRSPKTSATTSTPTSC
jgi:hypothetical protein